MIIVFGIVMGLVLGLTGAGGSVFAVPLLVLGLGWSLTDAAPVSLVAVCAATSFGTVVAWDRAYVRYRAAMLMAAVGTLVAPLGFRAAAQMPAATLALLFSATLVIVALRMMAQARAEPQGAAVMRANVAGDAGTRSAGICRLHPQSGRLIWTAPCAAVIALIGAVTGIVSGLLGVGGGFVIVPALRSVSALSIHSAVATSLMAIALTSAGTVLVHIVLEGPLPWQAAAPFVAGAMLGMLAGRQLAPRVAGPALQKSFALCMLAVAGLMALRTAG